MSRPSAAESLAPSETGDTSQPSPAAGAGRLTGRGLTGCGLAWPRLSWWLELATVVAGYGAYALVRLGVRAGRQAAFTHAALLWRFEQRLHLDMEPSINHLISGHFALADGIGYYYGLLHFIVTPLVLAWLYLCRPAAFPGLRSALILATTGANIVFWTWPLAPPRFAVPGMTDTLVVHHILGAASPHGVTGLVDMYAAMPSLHVAWATWCAAAVVTTTRGRWRHLAWLYPAGTTFVVLASANHFVLDAIAGMAIIALGLLAAAPRNDAGAGRREPAARRPPPVRTARSGGYPAFPVMIWWPRPRARAVSGYGHEGQRSRGQRRSGLRLPAARPGTRRGGAGRSGKSHDTR